MRDQLSIGQRVTLQPRCYFDGAPVKDWPDPQLVGVVVKVFDNYGVKVAKVTFPAGSHGLYDLALLHKVS